MSLRNNQTGTLSVIPFSEVTVVENFTKEYAFYYTNIQVGYQAEYDAVDTVLQKIGEDMQKDEAIMHDMLATVEVRGISAFEESGYAISCRIKTRPGRQRVVGRYFNRMVKKVFDQEGVEFPYPTRTLHIATGDQNRLESLAEQPSGEC